MAGKQGSSDATRNRADLVLVTHDKGVSTLTMNMPRRLNGWTEPMMARLKEAFAQVAAREQTGAVILTGADPYYCAGVNLGGTLTFGHPKKIHGMIKEHNQALFDMFLDFPKPILVAANGPAIGASVTSATLCDAIVASEKATFSTPFAVLGACPEGCSSILFERLMGKVNAERMLGDEGYKPDAAQALEAGLIDEVVPHEQLMSRAQAIAEAWVEQGRERSFRAGSSKEELKRVNVEESANIADCFLDSPFLSNQFRFLWRKKKRVPAVMFLSLWLSRPLWSKLL